MQSINQISEMLKSNNSFVILSHYMPDGDAIGSSLAVYEYLKLLGKSAIVILNDKVPDNFMFLDSAKYIKEYNSQEDDDLIMNTDAIVVVDLNQSSRLKNVEEVFLKSKAKKCLIDHHIDTGEIADYYYIDPNAAATGELVYSILKSQENFVLTKEIATAIYVAIMTDTGSFRFPSTSSKIHNIIADLIDAGAMPETIYNFVYNQGSISALKLFGAAFLNAKLYFDNKLCILYLTRDDFETANAKINDIEGLTEKTLSIKGSKVGIVFTEVPDSNEIKISFRAKDNYEIRDIAVKYGGGGHSLAAGATVKNKPLFELIDEIVSDVKILFEQKTEAL